jgi:hypothetical protein
MLVFRRKRVPPGPTQVPCPVPLAALRTPPDHTWCIGTTCTRAGGAEQTEDETPRFRNRLQGAARGGRQTKRLAARLDEDRQQDRRPASPPPVLPGSDVQRALDRDHRGAACVDGVDDLGVVNALEVDRGDAEVGVAELALAGHLDGVGVAELVRREASPHASLAGDAAQL